MYLIYVYLICDISYICPVLICIYLQVNLTLLMQQPAKGVR